MEEGRRWEKCNYSIYLKGSAVVPPYRDIVITDAYFCIAMSKYNYSPMFLPPSPPSPSPSPLLTSSPPPLLPSPSSSPAHLGDRFSSEFLQSLYELSLIQPIVIRRI